MFIPNATTEMEMTSSKIRLAKRTTLTEKNLRANSRIQNTKKLRGVRCFQMLTYTTLR